MTDIGGLLATYPRTRPPLTPAHEAVYEREYKLNRTGSGKGGAVERAAKWLESWMHRQVAAREGAPVLELGAGTLNHLPFERDAAPYDVVEPFHALLEGSPHASRVRDRFDSAAEVPEDRRYQRIVSVAVLEHMTDLPVELARAGLLLAPGGWLQAGIPSEGGLLWWASWRFGTGSAYYLRNRIDYGVVMRHEHVNTAPEILALVRYFFQEVNVRRFPTPLHGASFYAYLEARDPNTALCRRTLSGARSG